LKAASKTKSSANSKGALEQPKSTSPPKKKRKVDAGTKPQPSKHNSTTKPPPTNSIHPDKILDQIATPPTKGEELVTKIAKSTASRAQSARRRALNISQSASKGKKPPRRKVVGAS